MSDGISYAPVAPENAREWIYYLHSLNGLELSDYRGWQSIADYMALLDRRVAQNVAAQVPYANIRVLAKGWDRSPPDDAQMRHMQQLVDDALAAGAVGLSTGLDYISQCFASTDEIVEVCHTLRLRQRVYATHVRYKKGVLAGVEEAVSIGCRAGIPVHISHLKCDSPAATEELLSFIERVAIRQVDFSFDVYPYMPGSSMLSYFLPYEVWEDGPLKALEKLASPAIRRRFAAHLVHRSRPSLENVRLAWVASKSNTHWQGRTLQEFVDASGKPAEDALCDLLIDENLAVLVVVHGADDQLIEPFLAHPRFMLGSDGIFFPGGIVHPRQFGSAPRILGSLVRDRKLFSLEEAVRKMTSFPAERFGLTDRGVLRAGAFADLAIFNPDTIADQATYTDPQRPATGIEHLLVNGQFVIRSGQPILAFQGDWPGRAIP
jgi:N-acyl-D-amino-acid deacylase